MDEQWATDHTEEKTCTVNDLADNDLRFRDMDLFKVNAEHGQRLWKMVLPYRRMLRISWMEHVTYDEVFNKANTKSTLLDGLLKRKLAFHGHVYS